MSRGHNSPDGPEDIDAAFAEIVADLERDTKFGRWPGEDEPAKTSSEDDQEPRPAESTAPQPAVEPPAEQGPRDWTPAEEEEEHFVPPEPPPLPVPRPATFLGVGVIVLGVLVLLVPGLAGIAATVKLPLGLVLISAGIGVLLFRLRRTPPEDPDDDGAQV
ncbi:DUF308 domain-containing protein [Saccharopolyspora rhizosphaerae]|uniref:DUF308 domain-containing protein n=1 Tax=Saccharopolyspora rhizosphaerae TaxID=2492662 RepID=A0A3R8NWL6_9PSEU|nr:DUF308 domain-containing protein [Saccharopolyspora rhizosphaerae]RRO14885.1 DUF308 domain-containing protein [Saccharopolyspora rhizosphaerae]